MSIAGTLTYEDVNNVDAVGLVTARTGVRVTTGGIVVSNGGLDITGVSTFASAVDINANVDVDGTVDSTGVITALRFETTTSGDASSFYAGKDAGLTADTNSDLNVCIGERAGYDLAGSDANVAIGYYTMSDTSNFNSFGNIALGAYALRNVETGDYNMGAGYQALDNLTSGTGNMALGAFSMISHTTGNYNTALGYDTLRNTTERAGNVALGAFALRDAFNADFSVAIGYNAGRDSETDNTVLIGQDAGYQSSGYGGIAIGYRAGYDLEGNYNVMLGSYTGYQFNNGGSYNVGLGYAALYQDAGLRDYNIGIGFYSLLGNNSTATGDYNIGIGRETGELLTSGAGNVFIGNFAGEDVTSGSNNVVIKATQANYADVDATTSEQLWIGYDDKAWIKGASETVELRYNNSTRLETTNGGINVTGILTATSFVGDGSALTGLPSGGIEVFNNGTSVGAGATKIDFGEGVSVSPVVSGIATVTTSSNTGVLTTTSTSQVAISTFSTATYSSGLFTISVQNGGNVSLAQVNVVTTGSEVFVSEFGNVNSGPGLSTFSAHVSGSNVELLAYPTYSTSTTLSVNKKLFALGYGAGITTNASYSTSWKIIDTFSATAHKAVVYEIEAKRGSQILISKINLVHDGTEVYLSEFGTLGTSNITQFTGSISGSTVRLQAKANSSTTTDYTVRRTFF